MVEASSACSIGPATKAPSKAAVEHAGDEIGRGRRPQAQRYLRKAPVKIGEQRRQPHRGGRFHRADRQRPLRLAIVACCQHCLARQRRHPLREREQAAAGAGQGHAAAVPLEQRGADFGFQRFHPLRHVGLHGVEFFGGAGDAAGARHRREGHEIGQFHGEAPFQYRDGSILKYSFLENDNPVYSRCPDQGGIDADRHAADHAPGYETSDPVGADGCDCGRAPHHGGERRPAVLAFWAAAMASGRWLEAETAKLKKFSGAFGIGFITWSLAKTA